MPMPALQQGYAILLVQGQLRPSPRLEATLAGCRLHPPWTSSECRAGAAPTSVRARSTAAGSRRLLAPMSASACAGVSRAQFNRRGFAMPSSGLREPERLHRRARRLDCPGVGRLGTLPRNFAMYIPPAFRVEDANKLAAFIQRHSFSTLITHDGTAPFASHLPMLYRPDVGSHGTLVAHMARANPQWQHFTLGREALVVFHGPHSYISPSWYQTKPAVPTWNYAAVHAYGIPAVFTEHERVVSLLRETVSNLRGVLRAAMAWRPSRRLPRQAHPGHRRLRDSHHSHRRQVQARSEPASRRHPRRYSTPFPVPRTLTAAPWLG